MRDLHTSATTEEIEQVQAEDGRLRAAARRRPLMQYVVSRYLGDGGIEGFRVDVSPAGSKPSHELIDRPRLLAIGDTLGDVRAAIPAGYTRYDRRKDDRVDVVEVWV